MRATWVWILTALIAGIGMARAQGPAVQEGGQGEVAIRKEWFGVGNIIRPGEWIGVRLQVNDSNDKPREVLIRIASQDADGDKPMWEGTLTTNPGVNQPVWAYLRLPATFKASDPLRAYVYAAVEGPALAPGLPASPTAGRQLGATVFQAQRVLLPTEGMLGIVGNRTMGLRRYAGTSNNAWLTYGHERWEVIDRLDAETLPDRWMGLMPFAALVWNEPPPASLGSERSQALREWVTRGGHLVVVLPRLAQTWTDEANNPLFDIVPRVNVTRRDGFNLEPLRPLITFHRKEGGLPRERLDMPANEVLHTFSARPGASPREAMGIISMPAPDENGQTEWIVVRRQVGMGMVTLVGLDAASRWMEQHGLPDTELFWHRILGRRGQMPAGNQESNPALNNTFGRTPSTVDNNISDMIAKQTLAGAGVLMGLVVFVVYWLAAGPLGYAALKRSGFQRHAWVGFVAAAAVFTGVAWGGASLIRPARTSAAHVSILDHVYTPEGSTVQRARSWLSVLIPYYGDASLSIGDPSQAGTRRFHNLLAPWESPRQSSAGFPDARAYRINSRAPDTFTIPARSTVKQFQADWAGGPVWKMPRPMADASGATQQVTADRIDMPRGEQSVALKGSLVHDLPEAINEAYLVVSLGQRPLSRSLSNKGAWRLSSDLFVTKIKSWDPGTPLDLSKILPDQFSPGDKPVQGSNPGAFGAMLEELNRVSDQMEGGGAGGNNLGVLATKFTALTFLGLIEPPREEDGRGYSNSSRPLARREATHGWDLSNWMTQPCLVIVGRVGGDKTACPVPITYSTGGEYRPVPTEGVTFIRWVYPLPPKPPVFGSSSDPAATEPADPKDPT